MASQADRDAILRDAAKWLCSLCSGESPLVITPGNPDVPGGNGLDFWHDTKEGRFLCTAWRIWREIDGMANLRPSTAGQGRLQF